MQKYQLIVILTHKYLYGGFIIHFFGQKPVPVIADRCQHLGICIELARNFVWLFSVRCCSSALLSLTSFETVLLDCIVRAVISVGIKKKNSSKLVNFCVAILILKMEGKKQHFWHFMLYYFMKDKKATETQEQTCAVCGEGGMTDQM